MCLYSDGGGKRGARGHVSSGSLRPVLCVWGCVWVGGSDAKNEQLLRECQLASFDMNTSSKHSKFATVTALL